MTDNDDIPAHLDRRAIPPPADAAAPQSWRDVLPVHPACDLFPLMSPDELKTLSADIDTNGLHHPPVLWRNPVTGKLEVIDGRNRFDAIELIPGRKATDADVRVFEGTEDEVRAFIIASNIHRRHLTAEQKRELLAKLIKADPTASDRSIAEKVKLDHKTVGATRSRLEATGEIPQLKKTVGADGKARKAKRTSSSTPKRKRSFFPPPSPPPSSAEPSPPPSSSPPSTPEPAPPSADGIPPPPTVPQICAAMTTLQRLKAHCPRGGLLQLPMSTADLDDLVTWLMLEVDARRAAEDDKQGTTTRVDDIKIGKQKDRVRH